ncbi:MAG: hypothetical protein JW809_14385 [Pirellulales bacterium]|nr:hypothetical protein [Pirellulales bacterium]
MRHWQSQWHSAWLIFALIFASPALAADFRVENKVFAGSAKEPVSRSTTLFHGGVVYDFLVEPNEVTVFDPARGRFWMLDPSRRLKTELTFETIDKAMSGLKSRAAAGKDEKLQFLCNPTFEQATDETNGELVFSSPWVTYRVIGEKADAPEIASQYRAFSDWSAKLNAFLRPGSQPPFARMIVNEALAAREESPRKVELTSVRKQGLIARRTSIHSEHLLSRRLLESDRRRVAQTDEYMAIFSPVGPKEYEARLGKPKQ